jgi:hypothetical protein
MANEISLNVSLTLTNGYQKESISPGQILITQAAIGRAGGIFSIGTSEEDLTLPDISTLGYAYFRNLDTTNFVDFGPKSGGSMVAFCRLKAGEVGCLRLTPGITIRCKADTAAVKLDVRVLEA